MVDVDGSEATRFRCPPGTNNAGDWTNAMGTTCNLGPARETLSEISQGARAMQRIGKPKTPSGGQVDAADVPSTPKRRGVRERVAGILDRFAERARPTEDRERRRSLLTPSKKPDGPTSGPLPERERIQIDKPEKPKTPTGPGRAVAAATDDAKKRNVKNNGKKVVGSQFGQNFGKEDAAKKQAIDAAKTYNKRVFIIKNDNAAARPYRVVDEDRARIAKNGTIVGVVDSNGKHRSLDTEGFTPNDAIDELDKNPDFGAPRGPNGPSGPKTPTPKPPSERPEDRRNLIPDVAKHLTEEEKVRLEGERKSWDDLYVANRMIIDEFADNGSIEDIEKIKARLEQQIWDRERYAAAFLQNWRQGDDESAFAYHSMQFAIENDKNAVAFADSALERARLVKKNNSERRDEAARLQREQEEALRRAAEAAGVNPEEPKEPRVVGVNEIFEPKKPQVPTAQEPKPQSPTVQEPNPRVPTSPEPPSTGVPELDRKEIKDKLDPDVPGYQDSFFEVTHGNEVVEGFFMPKEVPVGNAGIDTIDDATKHLMDGGSLDDVPDEFLRDAILQATGDPDLGGIQGNPRFTIVSADPGNGINAMYAQQSGNYFAITYIVRDEQTGRQYIVKSPTVFYGEFANELYGQYMQQLLGLHTARFRIAGSDPDASDNWNLPFVMEHFGDIIPGGVQGDGESLPRNEWAFYLKDNVFDAPSKNLLTLMDAVLDNGDRHYKNWLFNRGPNGEMTVLGIDNGAAGAEGNPIPTVRDMRQIILDSMASEPNDDVRRRIRGLLDRIDTERAFLALDALEEKIIGTDGFGSRHYDPYGIESAVSDPAVTRIKQFLEAIKQLKTDGLLNV